MAGCWIGLAAVAARAEALIGRFTQESQHVTVLQGRAAQRSQIRFYRAHVEKLVLETFSVSVL